MSFANEFQDINYFNIPVIASDNVLLWTSVLNNNLNSNLDYISSLLCSWYEGIVQIIFRTNYHILDDNKFPLAILPLKGVSMIYRFVTDDYLNYIYLFWFLVGVLLLSMFYSLFTSINNSFMRNHIADLEMQICNLEDHIDDLINNDLLLQKREKNLLRKLRYIKKEMKLYE